MAEQQATQASQKTHRYPCPGCGADLVFEPHDHSLTCPYCGRKETLPTTIEQVEERSYEEYLRPRSEQLTQIAAGALQVSCRSCGATVEFTPPEVAGECPFCASTIVAQPKSADPLVAPEAVLPFRVSTRDGREAIKKWLASLWFAPNALKKLAYQESLSGIYLPYWTYDSHTTTFYKGQRGEYYYETQTYTERDAQGNMVTKTRQVRHTRWYSASGEVARWFNDLLVPGTTSVASNRLAQLNPWPLDALKPYDPAFLAGYKAQRYVVNLETGFEQAKQLMTPVIEGDVRKDIGGDEQRISELSTSYSAITFKHILLPVYIAAYRFNNKVYQVLVNACTCEVQGERPYSAWKIAGLVILILIVIAVIYFASGR
jgi:DNA-directed RNA polymerase subunit RPC12/RpoP